ncbi:MAG: acylphosphatase [Pirellulales bacterium]|nr:acylphosphatase [Pirellulales bacterium]
MVTSATVRRTLHYSGRVQGVGFRYTAQRIATSFSVTGYVQNLSDGRVRLVAEGEPAELDDFLGKIAETMGDYIRNFETFASSSTGEFQGFRVQGSA